jgi:excisionase family DNA binding protein
MSLPPEKGLAMRDDMAPAITRDPDEREVLLTPTEVAEMFRVNPKTVTRWAKAGKISAIRTLGGHRRFRASEIIRFLDQLTSENGAA